MRLKTTRYVVAYREDEQEKEGRASDRPAFYPPPLGYLREILPADGVAGAQGLTALFDFIDEPLAHL